MVVKWKNVGENLV